MGSLQGDFNNDGRPDMLACATSPFGSSSLRLWLAEPGGDYTLTPTGANPFGGGDTSLQLLSADFNQDGNLDVLVRVGNRDDPSQSWLVLLRGSGLGNFTLQARVALPGLTRVEAVGDFNGDGRQDAAVGLDANSVQILLGDGAGGLTPGSTLPLPASPRELVVGRFDADVCDDLAVHCLNGTTFHLILGSATANFALGGALPFEGTALSSLGTGLDGYTDLATGASGRLTVLDCDGNDGFSVANSTVAFNPVYVRRADFDRDGVADYGCLNDDRMAILLERGGSLVLQSNPWVRAAGGFAVFLGYSVAYPSPPTFHCADLNQDGIPDLGLSYLSTGVQLVLTDGHGNAPAPTRSDLPDATVTSRVALGRLDGNASLDVLARAGSNRLRILLNDGSGGLTQFANVTVPDATDSAALADFTGDSKTDAVVLSTVSSFTSANVNLLPGDGAGSLGTPTTFPVHRLANRLVLADLNSDGRPDVVVGTTSTDNTMLLNDGAGGFTRQDVAGGSVVAVGDFTGDGVPDLAAAVSSRLRLLVGQGDGVTYTPVITTLAFNLNNIGGDFTGDGKLDLAGVDSTGTVRVLKNDGTGNFTALASSSTTSTVRQVSAADLNSDGRADLIVGQTVSTMVFLTQADGTLGRGIVYGRGGYLGLGDLTGDGLLDVLTEGLFLLRGL